jgi:tetrahydromethanopterin S-methyltransferase subunit A
VIKNTITNPTIEYLLLVGEEPKGHKSGETFLALSKNGVDDKMRVIGSTGKRPILRNVSVVEINSFRKQVEIVDMIGYTDENLIVDKIRELAIKKKSTPKGTGCGCASCEDDKANVELEEPEIIQAKEPSNIIMDKAGYFVILPLPEKNIINVEHYSYDNTLLRVIEGKDARSIYWTIINNNWVTLLSHAAYLGKELEKAELSLMMNFSYIQDGA